MNTFSKLKIMVFGFNLLLVIACLVMWANNELTVRSGAFILSMILIFLAGLYTEITVPFLIGIVIVLGYGGYSIFNKIQSFGMNFNEINNYAIIFDILQIVILGSCIFIAGYISMIVRELEIKFIINNDPLFDSNIIDVVTGLKNYTGFSYDLNKRLAIYGRTKKDFSVYAFKINYFDELKARYGVQKAKKVAINIAKIIQLFLRESDEKYTIAEDSFALIIEDEKVNFDELTKRLKISLKNTELDIALKGMGKSIEAVFLNAFVTSGANYDKALEIISYLERCFEYDIIETA